MLPQLRVHSNVQPLVNNMNATVKNGRNSSRKQPDDHLFCGKFILNLRKNTLVYISVETFSNFDCAGESFVAFSWLQRFDTNGFIDIIVCACYYAQRRRHPRTYDLKFLPKSFFSLHPHFTFGHR